MNTLLGMNLEVDTRKQVVVHDNIIDYITTHVFLYIGNVTHASKNIQVVYGTGKIYHEIAATFHSILVLGSFILLLTHWSRVTKKHM